MSNKKCPCEECILRAICAAKRELECHILWFFITTNGKRVSTTLHKVRKIMPNTKRVRSPLTAGDGYYLFRPNGSPYCDRWESMK